MTKAYDDADYCRAVQAYKFFLPTVSFEGTWRGNIKEGAFPNEIFPLLERDSVPIEETDHGV